LRLFKTGVAFVEVLGVFRRMLSRLSERSGPLPDFRRRKGKTVKVIAKRFYFGVVLVLRTIFK
jgi:hypothetical protein